METEEREDVSQKHTANMKEEASEDVTSGHTCGVCGRSFPLLSSLSQHMRRHTTEKPYKCPYCEHRTAQKGSLKAHIRSHKLGLLDHNPSVKEEDGNQKQTENTETPDPAEITTEVTTSEKSPQVNGKVKKKATKKKVKGKNSVKTNQDGSFSCTLCSQVFPQVLLLKSHMEKHRSSQDHGCRLCGRRFREPWFLQSHMRTHRVKDQLPGRSNEPPATINEVPQDPATLIHNECLYELCAGCGYFFSDRETLRTHEKLHKKNHRHTPTPRDSEASEQEIAKRYFMQSLSLTHAGAKDPSEEKRLGLRIPQLDPVCSYQAWQLATRGRLVEATEKREERGADAKLPHDTDKGENVPLKQKKKRERINTSCSNVKRKKVDAVPDPTSPPLAHTKGGDKKNCHKDRSLFNGLGHAFYEALQNKTPKPCNSIRSQDQEDKKPYICKHCDFHTVDASQLRSHLHKDHQDLLESHSRHSTILDIISQSGPKTSRHPQNVPEVKRPGQTCDDAVSLLNLSALPAHEGDSTVDFSVKTEGIVRQQCPYCSHTTNYPEVLWIHQRVAHRVDGSSSMAPKWAPCTNSLKILKAGTSQWRRTGPPPFLEGKDCPALPAPRSQRTQAPDVSTPNPSARTQSQSKTHSHVPKSKHSSKDSHSSDGTHSSARMGLLPQKKSAGHNRVVEGGSKNPSPQATSSSSIVHSKSDSSFQPSSSPKHRGHRAAMEGNFPQEGLGFMLARSYDRPLSNPAAERLRPRRHSYDSSSGLKGPDLWAPMNTWGLQGSKAYFEPLLFAQGKSESAGEMPMDVDILSLLKNYNPHDLAALYQHWGFIDPRIEPQAMLQLNGYFENHSSSEASKQTNSRSTSSSGSLHKET
ncbi:zinc finger protein 516-like [Solea senegalensis]|uniref:Zinc finger protein 516-like n=1 Tax=Solea senegalensis TaxID=28829 RepID=A0AAV6R636_SOLSE|nr:zinc finger protein 516-like [Solea senegalensis]XP_043909163.1 zinc finger protein 516-like [Solea senegalensis]KAG7500902.1 zinc finger protein 516-like [Solea senegalensis]